MVGNLRWIPSKQNLLEMKYIKSFANKGHMCYLTYEPLKESYITRKWKWNILDRAVQLRYYFWLFVSSVKVILNDVYWRGGDLRQTRNITWRYGTFEVKLRVEQKDCMCIGIFYFLLFFRGINRYLLSSIKSQISLRILSSGSSLHYKYSSSITQRCWLFSKNVLWFQAKRGKQVKTFSWK